MLIDLHSFQCMEVLLSSSSITSYLTIFLHATDLSVFSSAVGPACSLFILSSLLLRCLPERRERIVCFSSASNFLYIANIKKATVKMVVKIRHPIGILEFSSEHS